MKVFGVKFELISLMIALKSLSDFLGDLLNLPASCVLFRFGNKLCPRSLSCSNASKPAKSLLVRKLAFEAFSLTSSLKSPV